MPNWVKNIVKVSKKTMDDIEKNCFSPDENGKLVFDFEKLIPMPKSLRLTEGSITNIAIQYAMSKMNIKDRNELIKELSSRSHRFYGDYWSKYKSDENGYSLERLEKEKEEFKPGPECKELRNKNFKATRQYIY